MSDSVDQVGSDPLFFEVVDEAGVLAWVGPVRLFTANVSCNGNSATAWLQIFDSATVLGADIGGTDPVWSIPIPAGAVWDSPWTKPISFSNGIVLACTSTATGSSAPSGDATVNISIQSDGLLNG